MKQFEEKDNALKDVKKLEKIMYAINGVLIVSIIIIQDIILCPLVHKDWLVILIVALSVLMGGVLILFFGWLIKVMINFIFVKLCSYENIIKIREHVISNEDVDKNIK